MAAENSYDPQAAGMKGTTLSKVQIALIVLLIIALIVIIIVLAAVLGVENNKSDDTDESKQVSKGGTTPTPTFAPGVWDNVRLPSKIRPSHYELHMNLDPEKDTFTGDVTADVNVTERSPYVVVHSRGLNVTSVSVKDSQAKDVDIKISFLFPKNQYHVIEMDSSLEPGQYKVKYEFGGKYARGLFGLYKGINKLITGTKAGFVATLLEPIDARSLFPCFDEPAFKATFKISVTHPKGMQAFSNMGVESSEEKENNCINHYHNTVKMSTYLVAFVVGNFEHIEGNTTRGTKLRIIAQPGRKDQMRYALKIAKETLTQLEDYFGINYPLAKMDLIAPPESFIAMENWGLINFEEDGLLYKEGFSNEEVKQNLLVRWLPHEIVHMWFGNLVTLNWWNEIWLNEAFADYFTYHQAVPASNRDWKEEVQFIHTNLAFALELDGYKNTRSVVEHTILPTFGTLDNIVYKKGSSVIKMLISLIGKDTFKKGIKRYLETHQYGNAVTDDMWRALQAECPISKPCIDIKAFGDPWVNDLGYPVVTVAPNGTLLAEQFLYDEKANKSDMSWDIPFTYKTASDATIKTVWIRANASGNPPKVTWSGKEWIKGNVDQIGVYRVSYPSNAWSALTALLKDDFKKLSAMDRYGLIDDAFSIARAGRIPGWQLRIDTAMDLVDAFIEKETEYVVWEAYKAKMKYIKGILDPQSKTYTSLLGLMAVHSNSLLAKLGYGNSGTHLDKLNRMTAVEFSCASGSKDCLKQMDEMMKRWKSDERTTAVTPALRKLVFYYGVRNGGEQDWDRVHKRIEKSIIASEMQPLLYGLAGSRDLWRLDRLLHMMIDETEIKKQYAKYVLDYVANENPMGVQVAWSFVRGNWEKLKKRSGSAMMALLTYIPTVSKRFSTQYLLDQLTSFVEDNLEGQAMPRHLAKAIEVVRANIQWRENNEKSLETWLGKRI